MNGISDIFFDLDGTLADPKFGITTCIQHALHKLGRSAPDRDDLIWCIGPPLRDNMKRLLATEDPALIEEGVKAFRDRYNTVGMFEYEHYEGIRNMLDRLSRGGFRLSVVSSKAAFYLPTILEHLGFSDYFSGTYGPDLSGRPDNKAELLASVLRELGANVRQSVMVGDREQDVTAGRSNGIKTIAVTWGYGSSGEIETASPDHTCNTPAKLAELIFAELA